MDMMTVNISMPRSLYVEAKKKAKRYHYASVSELVRSSLRWWLSDRDLTVNGFTPEFEAETLASEREPVENDVIWDGKESDLLVYDKNSKKFQIHPEARRVGDSKPRIKRSNKFAGRKIQKESVGYAFR